MNGHAHANVSVITSFGFFFFCLFSGFLFMHHHQKLLIVHIISFLVDVKERIHFVIRHSERQHGEHASEPEFAHHPAVVTVIVREQMLQYHSFSVYNGGQTLER